MKIVKHSAANAEFLDGLSAAWNAVPEYAIELFPTPLGMAQEVSPFMALSEDHGRIEGVNVRLAHNGQTLNVRMAWADPDKDDKIEDLDQFTDGAAVMFPLGETANAMFMGSEDSPVNAWLWKADKTEAFDVIARGYATSKRRPGPESGLAVKGQYIDGQWVVVFQRPLTALNADYATFKADGVGIAFGVWEGSNAERSGQKAMSGEFMGVEIEL